MNTCSNDQNVHVFEILERSHSLSRNLDEDGFFDQGMPLALNN